MNTKRRDDIEAIYPLSPMQQGILFHALSAPEAHLYFQQVQSRIRGMLDVESFRATWEQVVARHPILRTLFLWERKAEPLQVVRKEVKVPWQFYDWQMLSEDEQATRIADFVVADREQGLDLNRAPLMRLALFQLAPNEYYFIWTTHHILMDGWSQPIVLEEVLTLYQAKQRGLSVSLPTRRPYRDYIAWLQKQPLGQDEKFWREILTGFTSPTPLMIDNPSVQSHDVASDAYERLVLSADTTRRLREVARHHQLTRNTLIQAVWGLLLSRYSGQDDVVFGTLVSGRPSELSGAEKMVGLFINTLPMRIKVPATASVLLWLQELQTQQAELRQYEHAPLVRVQSWSDVPRGTPLFESVLAFQNYWSGAGVDESAAGLEIEPEVPTQTINYPLILAVTPLQEVTIEAVYDSHRFDADAIHRLLGHFRTLLEGLLDALEHHPQRTLRDLPLLTAAEEHQILMEWNPAPTPFAGDRCLHELIEAQAVARPDAIAVRFDQETLTYRQIDEWANQLAHELQALGLTVDTLVGLCVERSLALVVGVLAIMKAGGAYVPLDPTYPIDRLSYMINDAGLKLLLSQAHLEAILPAHNAHVVWVDPNGASVAHHPTIKPLTPVTPQNLAYAIYTSGSTGRPKRTLITHYGVANLSEAQRRVFDLRPENQVLQFSSLSFDAFVFEYVLALCQGSTLHLSTSEHLRPGPDLITLLREQEITNVTFPPSALATLPQAELPALRTILVAGEACSPDLVARWAPGHNFFNGYGPTESTIWATVAPCATGDQKPPIGRPIANTEIYLLDAHLRPVPVGIPGEIHIGGVGLARGYDQRAGLTAEKFIPHPFSNTPGARLYKSGDVARYLPDGNIDFLGRIDHQVKVRGFRIELGEIEAVLARHPGVRETIVLAQPRRNNTDYELVAYMVPKGEMPTTSDLRTFLQQTLPDFMVPAYYHALAAMPLTPNGKVDRKALASITPDQVRSAETVAPRTPTEEQLAAMWVEMLSVPQVGVYDNFFELGGHSLLVTQLVFRIREAFEVELPLNQLFAAPTVASLAMLIEAKLGRGSATPVATATRDWETETVLDDSISIAGIHASITPPRSILLTGATGFLGAFLLAELLKQTDATIFVLVRADTPDIALHRVIANLSQYGIWQKIWKNRIRPIVGDLAKPRLGLHAAIFANLATTIDVIYHNGALVNFVQPYEMLKAANVQGTEEVIRFAATKRIKPIHFVSTLSVFGHADHGILRENDPLATPDTLEGGYAQTKWVGERLIERAAERGIPIAIYRPGRITGDSRSGEGSTDDFFYRMLKGCIQMGSIPKVEMPVDMIPVDFVARAIVYLAQNTVTAGKHFHLVNPAPMPLSELVAWIRTFGYPLAQIPYEQWRTSLIVSSEQSDANALYPLLATFGRAAEEEAQSDPIAIQVEADNTVAGLADSMITCPPVDAALLSIYFNAFVRKGFLAPPPTQTQRA